MSKRLSEGEKRKILTFRAEGLKVAEIVRRTGHAKGTVYGIVSKAERDPSSSLLEGHGTNGHAAHHSKIVRSGTKLKTDRLELENAKLKEIIIELLLGRSFNELQSLMSI